MGSTETDSTPELHKLYIEEGLYVTCAGRVEMAAEVVSIFHQELKKLSSRTHGAIWDALNIAVHEHRMMHFKWDIVAAKHMFTPGAIFEKEHDKIIEEWQNYDIGLQMLVGTFHHSGMALLYYVGPVYERAGWVHFDQFPGFATIGTGSQNANFWLNFRGQHLGLNPKQSAYHA